VIAAAPPALFILSPEVNKAGDVLLHDGIRIKVLGKTLYQREPVLGARSKRADQGSGEFVASQAKTWKGVDYKSGQTARCADFVRRVLSETGHNVPVARGSVGPLMADSFYDPALGDIILDKAHLQPGDVVMFQNTYDGPGRILPGANGQGRITHVGIYVGDGKMIDRPTASKPVQYRSIDTFAFHSALRPNEYKPAPAPDTKTIPDDTLKRAIGAAEGTLDHNGNPNAAYQGHKDPGNGKRNLGVFSFQHGASSPQEADQKQLARLRVVESRYVHQAQAKFGDRCSDACMVAWLDLFNQSPDAGNRFIKFLPNADPTPQQLIDARAAALNESRQIVGAPSPMNVPADQKRRVDALLEQVN
jgi:hypothetical protein